MKNIKDFIHLYLGCEVFVKKPKTRKPKIWTVSGVDNAYENSVRCSNGEYVCAAAFKDVKPLLRPLESMTEEEAFEYMKVTNPKVKQNDIRVKGCIEYIKETGLLPDEFIWALSKHFDLFGLIEAGLALPSNK